MKYMPQFHVPVLKEEVIHFLITNRSGIYVDGTIGGGGHGSLILDNLNKGGRLIGIDQDDEALAVADERLKKYHDRVIIRKGNFRFLTKVIHDESITRVDGIFLDLGVSSHQIDTGKRGFSYLTDGPLDMRMNVKQQLSAEHVVNMYSREDLANIFKNFGEERFAGKIANAIVAARGKHLITTTYQLVEIIKKIVPYKFHIKSLARIFQALRIAVNEELSSLRDVLTASIPLLNEGGRLVVISYHSLEDRIVKEFLHTQENPCTCPPSFPICICHKKRTVHILTKRVIKPSIAEIENNTRSRSARLRAAERI